MDRPLNDCHHASVKCPRQIVTGASATVSYSRATWRPVHSNGIELKSNHWHGALVIGIEVIGAEANVTIITERTAATSNSTAIAIDRTY